MKSGIRFEYLDVFDIKGAGYENRKIGLRHFEKKLSEPHRQPEIGGNRGHDVCSAMLLLIELRQLAFFKAADEAQFKDVEVL